jgi:hypothetical protein
MSTIRGRPKKARKQEKFVGYWVTMAQYFIIQQKAAKAHVNISDYMRQTAVYGYVKARWTLEERQMVKTISFEKMSLQKRSAGRNCTNDWCKNRKISKRSVSWKTRRRSRTYCFVSMSLIFLSMRLETARKPAARVISERLVSVISSWLRSPEV